MRFLGLGALLLLCLLAGGCGVQDRNGGAPSDPELVRFEQITREQSADRSPGEVREIAGAAAGWQRVEGVVTGCQEKHPPALVRDGDAWRLEYLPGTRSGVNCLVAEYYLVTYDVPA